MTDIAIEETRPAAAPDLVDDGEQFSEAGHRVVGQPGLPGGAGGVEDGVAVVDAGQALLRRTGVPAAMLTGRRRKSGKNRFEVPDRGGQRGTARPDGTTPSLPEALVITAHPHLG